MRARDLAAPLALAATIVTLPALADAPVPANGPTTFRANLGAGGVQANNWSFNPSLSKDGRYVTFASEATNLSLGCGYLNGVHRLLFRDLQTGAIRCLSPTIDGEPPDEDA